MGLSIATAFAAFVVFDTILSGLPEGTKQIVAALGLLVSSLTAVAVASIAAAGAMSWGTAVPIITAAVGIGAASIKGMIPAYATGGFPEDGLFYANSGEMVGQFSNGKTAVANNDQIVTGITQGVYSAMMAYNAQTRGQGGNGDIYLDGTKVGRVVAKGSHSEMVRVGLIKANS